MVRSTAKPCVSNHVARLAPLARDKRQQDAVGGGRRHHHRAAARHSLAANRALRGGQIADDELEPRAGARGQGADVDAGISLAQRLAAEEDKIRPAKSRRHHGRSVRARLHLARDHFGQMFRIFIRLRRHDEHARNAMRGVGMLL